MLCVPLYYRNKLISLNSVIGGHMFSYKGFKLFISSHLDRQIIKPITSIKQINYTLYMSRGDLMNVGCMIDKVFCDYLQDKGFIYNDSINYIKNVHFKGIKCAKGEEKCLIELT